MNIVVIAVDGLRASSLGAYGNTLFETPGFDRLASESLVADWCHGNTVELPKIYRALWQGAHSLRSPDYSDDLPSIAVHFAGAGYHTSLLSDDPVVEQFAGATDFDEIEIFETHESFAEGQSPASDLGSTHFAGLLSHLGQLLHQPEEENQAPQLVWLHTKGMYGTWDAPLAVRELHAEEDDPAPYKGVEPPCISAETEIEPDERLPFVFAYSAQVQAFDACLEALMGMIPENTEQETVVCLVGLRGFPLGEHGLIGGIDQCLSNGQLHTPLIVRTADRRGTLSRVGQLTEHADLLATIVEIADIKTDAASPQEFDGANLLAIHTRGSGTWRDHSIAASELAKTIRTPSWCLREKTHSDSSQSSQSDEPTQFQLFVRPDDVLEVNDVAALRQDIVDDLRKACTESNQRCENGETFGAPILPERLTMPVE